MHQFLVESLIQGTKWENRDIKREAYIFLVLISNSVSKGISESLFTLHINKNSKHEVFRNLVRNSIINYYSCNIKVCKY